MLTILVTIRQYQHARDDHVRIRRSPRRDRTRRHRPERHRGARVRQVSDAEAVEILQARAVLEGMAVRQTAERIDDAGIERVTACLARHRELLEGGDLIRASEANAELHATLLELSRNGTVQGLIRTLNAQTVRYQYRTILIPGRPAKSLAEHTAIVEAVVGRRPDDAESAMR